MKKTTKALSLLLSLCMMLSVFTFTVFAEETSNYKLIASGTCGDYLQWTLDNEGTLTISGTGWMSDYSFKESPWASYVDSIKLVIMENDITSIGGGAFKGCSALQNITIPSSVTTIGKMAFSGCKSLKSIIIPDYVTSVEFETFKGCSALESITLSTAVTHIGVWAFFSCESLQSITLPSSLTSIGNCAFAGCSSLKNVIIPDSVEYINDEAFDFCNSLQSITIPDSVTYIGGGAFGYYYDFDNGSREKIENFTIYGSKGSEVETYATENGFTFIDLEALPEADSKEYMDNETATMPNIVENTMAEELITSLSAYGIIATITDKNGNALDSNAKVGTGCKVTDQSENVYTVIVKGDVDGTGEIDSTDYMNIKQILIGTGKITGVYLNASDADGDGKITSTDYLRIKSHFIGEKNLFN